MYGKNRKPRQRNRPKNKVNRLKAMPQRHVDPNNKLVDDFEIDEENVRVESKVIGNVEKVTIAQSTAPLFKEAAVLTQPHSGSQVTSQTLYDQNSSLKLVQQMLRSEFLQQQQSKNEIEPKHSEKDCKNDLNVGKDKPSELSATASVNSVKDLKVKENSSNEKIREQSVFVANLQKKLENSLANGSTDLPNALLDNLQKLLNEGPLSDVESSDEDDEYIEYINKPRQYFLVALCNFCKKDLAAQYKVPCSGCNLTYYCTPQHADGDMKHRQLCYALQQVADDCGGHIFRKCAEFTTEQFRSYRIVTIRKVEFIINRPLTATEQEVILFPRICCNITCREYDFTKLMECENCAQVAYCRDKPEHLNKQHQHWCQSFQLFKQLELANVKMGRIEPTLPSKILRDVPDACCNTKQILSKLGCATRDPCEFAAASQISTCPLTAWYALKVCGHLKKLEDMTIHLIGAEIEFEVDALHKWELFLLHMSPTVNRINVVFVGPELNSGNAPLEQLKKTKCCRSCRKLQRTMTYQFQRQLYHDYCGLKTFLQPNLVCFFNAGLYRHNGFLMEDTWPKTIQAATRLKCPIVVTSYTEYEAPLDMARLIQESNRSLNVVLPPTRNPFSSEKPERNFISDEDAPLMFKNYYCFVVE